MPPLGRPNRRPPPPASRAAAVGPPMHGEPATHRHVFACVPFRIGDERRRRPIMVQRKKEAAGSQIHDRGHRWLQLYEPSGPADSARSLALPHAMREYLDCPNLKQRTIDKRSRLQDVCVHRPMFHRMKTAK